MSISGSCLVPNKQRISVVIKEERLKDIALARVYDRKLALALVSKLAQELTLTVNPDAFLIAFNVVDRMNQDRGLGLNDTEAALLATALGSAWRG